MLFVADPDDPEEHRAIEAEGEEMLIVKGNYAKKINRAIEETDEPLIFQGADDLRFHPGWLEAAKAKLGPGIGVVGTNDLNSKRVMAGTHADHALITREYTKLGTIDDPTKVLHERYPHEYVDDEFIETAVMPRRLRRTPPTRSSSTSTPTPAKPRSTSSTRRRAGGCWSAA